MELMLTPWLRKSMHISQQNNSAFQEEMLSARLSAIAESLPERCVVCDVGSDHGALPRYLLLRNLCSRAIVTDLNEKPLERAIQNLKHAGVDHRASFVLTDGIAEVLPYSPDAFVIAGMGGETILGILERALKKIPVGTIFVLQPMTKIPVLRRFLYEFGFSLQGEKLVFENNKYFIVISAVYTGQSQPEKTEFCEYGEFLHKEENDITRKYFLSLLSSLDRVISEKKKNGKNCVEEEKKRLFLLKFMEEKYESKRD